MVPPSQLSATPAAFDSQMPYGGHITDKISQSHYRLPHSEYQIAHRLPPYWTLTADPDIGAGELLLRVAVALCPAERARAHLMAPEAHIGCSRPSAQVPFSAVEPACLRSRIPPRALPYRPAASVISALRPPQDLRGCKIPCSSARAAPFVLDIANFSPPEQLPVATARGASRFPTPP